MQKIDVIYAFIASDDEGEGTTGFQEIGQWFPMVTADLRRVEILREMAQQIASASGKRVTLCKFSVREEEIEEFNP